MPPRPLIFGVLFLVAFVAGLAVDSFGAFLLVFGLLFTGAWAAVALTDNGYDNGGEDAADEF